MNNIFKLKYEGLSKRFLNTTSSKGALFDISLLYQKYIPKNSLLLRKLPSKEVKNVVKMECPTDNLSSNKEKEIVIQSSKNLRRLFDINEKNTCFKCSKKHSCKFFEESPINMNKHDYELIDLHYILYGYFLISNSNSFSNKQITEDNYLVDIEANSQSTSIVPKENLNNTEIVSNESVYRWNSAIVILDNLYSILEDLIYNNGVIYKILLNSFIDSQYKHKAEPRKLENKTETDPIESLITNLKKCRNRREKKILLAKFNNVIGIAWGDNKKILSKEKMNETLNQPIDCILDKKNLEGESTSSKQMRLGNTSLKALSTQKFSQKISFEKSKTKALIGRKNLALLLNKGESGSLTKVELPGKEYTQAVKYLSKKEDKITNLGTFNENINSMKDKYTVDLKKIQMKKFNKIDKALEKNRNITLLTIQNEEKERQLIEDKNLHRKSLSSFETKTYLSHSETSLQTNSHSLLPERAKEKGPSIHSIKIEKIKLKENLNNINIYKQRNEEKEGMQKMLREKALKKKILSNKHQYLAQNAYNNLNNEGIMYERDMDLQRSFKFEKKELKSSSKINKF